MLLLFLLVSPFLSSAQSPPPPTTLPSGTIYYYTTTATGQTFTSTWLLTPHLSHALITSPPPQQCNSFSAIWTMAPFGTEGGPYMYYDGYLGCRAWPTNADATGRPERQCCPDGFDGLGYYIGTECPEGYTARESSVLPVVEGNTVFQGFVVEGVRGWACCPVGDPSATPLLTDAGLIVSSSNDMQCSYRAVLPTDASSASDTIAYAAAIMVFDTRVLSDLYTSTSSSGLTTTTITEGSRGAQPLAAGDIAGIVIGSVAVVALIVGGAIILRRRRRRRGGYGDGDGEPESLGISGFPEMGGIDEGHREERGAFAGSLLLPRMPLIPGVPVHVADRDR